MCLEASRGASVSLRRSLKACFTAGRPDNFPPYRCRNRLTGRRPRLFCCPFIVAEQRSSARCRPLSAGCGMIDTRRTGVAYFWCWGSSDLSRAMRRSTFMRESGIRSVGPVAVLNRALRAHPASTAGDPRSGSQCDSNPPIEPGTDDGVQGVCTGWARCGQIARSTPEGRK